MASSGFQKQVERFENGNAEAAIIILKGGDRYSGLMLEWAQALAYRMVTIAPGSCPELECAWAKVAYKSAFNPACADEDQDDMSDLRAWHRR